MDKLLNCPFCGGEAKIVTQQFCEDAVATNVVCTGCGVHTEGCEDAYSNPGYAAIEWNTRPTAQASEAIPEQALNDARKALVSADHAIKGREHTGFIHKAIAKIDEVLQSTKVQISKEQIAFLAGKHNLPIMPPEQLFAFADALLSTMPVEPVTNPHFAIRYAAVDAPLAIKGQL